MRQFGQLALDTRGVVVAPHAADALALRAFGAPLSAALFHAAIGWGIALALQFGRFRPRSAVVAVLLGPSLAMIWDGAVRAIEWASGADRLAAVPVMLLLSLVLPLAVGTPLRSHAPRDLLLFSITVVNHAFLLWHSSMSSARALLSDQLKLLFLAAALASILLHARAAGMLAVQNTPNDEASLAADDRDALTEQHWFDRLLSHRWSTPTGAGATATQKKKRAVSPRGRRD